MKTQLKKAIERATNETWKNILKEKLLQANRPVVIKRYAKNAREALYGAHENASSVL